MNTLSRRLLRGLRSLILCPLALLAFSTSAATTTQPPQVSDATEVAVFAGGCFWCVESDFDNVPGVLATVSGYTGGPTADPTYKQVSAGGTGHLEAVQITFDPKRVSYETLLEVFWRSVDPTDAGGQFCDRGSSYATAIFASSPRQVELARASKQRLQESNKLKRPIATPILEAARFYPAEDYHQDYYHKNPLRYRLYRFNCGRDSRIAELWGDEAHQGIDKH
jgi:peptide-methionine (S)-S-oxide reductase